MALISCPECGGQISNSAKQCIHCGCEIKVCPECNKVYMANIEECEECGFKFAEKIDNEMVEQQEDCIYVYNKFKSSNPIYGILFSDLLTALFNILSFVLIIIASVKLGKWASGDALGGILKYNDTKNSINTLFIISMILLILASSIIHFNTFFLSRVFNFWCKSNKINLSYSIKNYFINNDFASKTEERFEKDKVVLDKCIDCEMLKNIAYKEKTRNKAVMATIIGSIGLIFVIIFFTGAVEDIMQKILLSSESYKKGLSLESLKWIKTWWTLIIGILFLIIAGKVEPDSKDLQRRRNEFIKKDFSDGYNNYIKYFSSKK